MKLSKKVLFVGGSSELGRECLKNFKHKAINFSLTECNMDDIIECCGDVRNTKLTKKIFEKYEIETIIFMIKPPLTGTSYKDFIEINHLGVIDTCRIGIKYGVTDIIYISSIAASSHYINHYNSNENMNQPYYSEYKSAYDLSKRMAEDYILSLNSKTVKTISIRLSGVASGINDELLHLRLPILLKINGYKNIDMNLASNISDAILHLYNFMNKFKKDDNCKNDNGHIFGKFYYYTGEKITFNEQIDAVIKSSGKYHICINFATWKFFVNMLLKVSNFLKKIKLINNERNTIDICEMSLFNQTFDNTKFLDTFGFKPKYKFIDFIQFLYS